MGPRHYFAACGRGLESALEGELRALGAQQVEPRRGGVAFQGDLELGYRANLWLRSAIRVQEQLLQARVQDQDDLYDAVARVDWERWIAPDQTLAIFASTRDAPDLRHSGFVALRAKDAIVDAMRRRCGRRPSVDVRQPDVPLKLIVQRDNLRLYRDLSGVSLHKRGWRPIQVKSPLNEATAAALLLLSGWDRRTPLADPMCGSGTFLVEAAMLAARRAPGLARYFAFERWLDHDARLWGRLREEARDLALPSVDVPLMGADRHAGALELARVGAYEADVDRLIDFRVADVRDYKPPHAPAFVVTNPPYGERIGREEEDLLDSWRALGAFLKRECPGACAWVLSGNPVLSRHLGLRASLRVPVMNGPIDCRWLRYDLHAGPAPDAVSDSAPGS